MWNDDENNFVLIKSFTIISSVIVTMPSTSDEMMMMMTMTIVIMYNNYDDGDNDNGDNDNKYYQSIISRYHIYMVDNSRYLYHH